MSLQTRATIQGLDAVLASLARVRDEVAFKAVRAGVQDGARQIVAAAKTNLRANQSVDTSTLVDSMGQVTKLYKPTATTFAAVGPRRDAAARRGKPAKAAKFRRLVLRRGYAKALTEAVPANYGRLVEFGTAPHAVGKGDRRAPRRKTAGFSPVQTGKPHPGAAPKPFLRPALYAVRPALGGLIGARIQAAVAAAGVS